MEAIILCCKSLWRCSITSKPLLLSPCGADVGVSWSPPMPSYAKAWLVSAYLCQTQVLTHRMPFILWMVAFRRSSPRRIRLFLYAWSIKAWRFSSPLARKSSILMRSCHVGFLTFGSTCFPRCPSFSTWDGLSHFLAGSGGRRTPVWWSMTLFWNRVMDLSIFMSFSNWWSVTIFPPILRLFRGTGKEPIDKRLGSSETTLNTTHFPFTAVIIPAPNSAVVMCSCCMQRVNRQFSAWPRTGA